ncbi:MAG TPA: IMP cyclohydrolase [Candidatus Nanoarchaeia archaeon]|nr:IMP cyclohydrolase [Candidatus Nanoarchaeia archaeon]
MAAEGAQRRGTDVTGFKRTYKTRVEDDLPQDLTLYLEREASLRYGENPNQPAAVYRLVSSCSGDQILRYKRARRSVDLEIIKNAKDGLSATNVMDTLRALDVLKFFGRPSVAVMKHLVPSGFATQVGDKNLERLYVDARDADARSAFGSVVVMNHPLDRATAEAVVSTFVEVVVAPEFEGGSLDVLESRKNLRAVRCKGLEKLPRFVGDDCEGLYDLKMLPAGRVVVQAPYVSSIRGKEDLVLDPLVRHDEREYVVERDPTERELDDLLTAWYVNLGVRSNGIVLMKEGVSVAIGSGQQERVGAVEQAIVKAYQKAMDREGMPYDPLKGIIGQEELSYNPLAGAVMSSDAFLPFRDSVDIVARVGVTAIIQPGGSERDYEVIEAANEHKMAMPFTLERCFGHF